MTEGGRPSDVDVLVEKYTAMIEARRKTLRDHFDNGKWGGSVLKEEIRLLEDVVADLKTLEMRWTTMHS